jgi:hypothetical protein
VPHELLGAPACVQDVTQLAAGHLSVTVRLQLLGQKQGCKAGAGPVEGDLHPVDIAAEHLGYLIVAQLLDLAEKKDLTVACWEAIERSGDQRRELGSPPLALGIGSEIHHLRRRALAPDHATSLAQLAQAEIGGDSIQPRLEPKLPSRLRDRRDRAREGLLDHVLSGGVAAQHAPGVAVDRLAIALIELCQGVAVASAGALGQLHLGGAGSSGRCHLSPRAGLDQRHPGCSAALSPGHT